jgi:hypothetical protein
MKKALLIGINYLSQPDVSLRGCIDDIVNMRNVLIDAYDYPVSDINMLRDDDTLNLPTRENVMNHFSDLAKQSAGLDELWLHYSGHGSQMRSINDTGKTDSVLVPLDYATSGFISEEDILVVLKQIKCRSILLFDSCHSGTICELPYTIQYIGPNQYSKQYNPHIQMANPNIYALSGCKLSQTSADTYSKILHEAVGAFTNAFITCLRNKRHKNDLFTLYGDVCFYLANNGYEQVPVLSTSSIEPKYTLIHAHPTTVVRGIMKYVLQRNIS